LLFFGFIRPYKGLDIVIDALGRLRDSNIHLTVVGEPWGSVEDLLKHVHASGAPNVELHLEYVDDATAAHFFCRADIVVLPYRAATPSAVAALAYHYERPVLATRVGGLEDTVEDGRTGFLIDPNAPDQLAERLQTIDRSRLKQMQPYVREYAARFTWRSLATAVAALADEIVCPS
jgi:glycosyltransferase involved in cell wall biosynthesis